MRRLVLWIALGLLISLASVPAGAEDFTFNVPVELHKIPAAIPTFVVSVSVYDAPPDAGGHWGKEWRRETQVESLWLTGNTLDWSL